MTKMTYLSIIGLILYFVILLFAVSKEKKNETSEDFFFAGRSLSFVSLAITFIASWWGAGSALSTADLAFHDGMGAFFYYGVPVLISTGLMAVMAPRIRQVGYLTQGKMMEARYSKKVSSMLSFMILIYMIFNAAAQMVGVGDYLGSSLAISYETAILIGVSIVLIYSMFGGFRAVVLTDMIQFIFLTLASIIVFITAMKFAGGLKGVEVAASNAGLDGYMSMKSGVSKYFAYVVTFGCSWMIQANVWQRISASRNNQDARKMTLLSFVVYIPMYLMVVITGMCGFALFGELPNGGIISSIVRTYMSPFLGSIVFVGITSAIMSTMDSLINTGAMTIVIDLKREKEEKQIKQSRVATIVVTAIALFIALKIRSILKVSWIASDVITTGVFVPLVMGFYNRRGTAKGAYASMVFGLIYCSYHLLVQFGIQLPMLVELGSIQQVIYGMIGSLIVYLTVSGFDQPNYQQADLFIQKSKGIES